MSHSFYYDLKAPEQEGAESPGVEGEDCDNFYLLVWTAAGEGILPSCCRAATAPGPGYQEPGHLAGLPQISPDGRVEARTGGLRHVRPDRLRLPVRPTASSEAGPDPAERGGLRHPHRPGQLCQAE